MLDELKRTVQSTISRPFPLQRVPTIVSASDSSTTSSVDDSSLEKEEMTGSKHRRCHQERIEDSTKSQVSKGSNGGRSRQSISSTVSFGEITIREYNRALGDWWDIPNSLGLGWDYIEHPSTPLHNIEREQEKQNDKIRCNQIKELKGQINAWFQMPRKKENSVISDGAMKNVNKGKKRRGKGKDNSNDEKLLSYEQKRPTAKVREDLLRQFGFTKEELVSSEEERKRLRMEYLMWTQSTNHKRRNKPSSLFSERCLADVNECVSEDGEPTFPSIEDSTVTATKPLSSTCSAVSPSSTEVTSAVFMRATTQNTILKDD